MGPFRTLPIACLLLFFGRPAIAEDQATLPGWIAWFRAHDPVADATTNQSKGTIYVIGRMGYGFYYPGIGDSQGRQVEKEHGVRHLPATLDIVEGELHRQYLEIATAYAEKYNQATLKLLGIRNDPQFATAPK